MFFNMVNYVCLGYGFVHQNHFQFTRNQFLPQRGIEYFKVVFCRVRTHHTRGMVVTPGITLHRTSVSSVGCSYPYSERLQVLYARCLNTRGAGTACFVPPRNFCELCTPMPQYLELLEVVQDFRTRTRKFWKFCKNPIPLPGTSVSSVRL